MQAIEINAPSDANRAEPRRVVRSACVPASQNLQRKQQAEQQQLQQHPPPQKKVQRPPSAAVIAGMQAPSMPVQIQNNGGFLDKYTLYEQIGKGAYANVYKCRENSTKKIWAVKIVDKSKTGPKDINDVYHEMEMMKAVGNHPCIVQFKEFFETPEHMYLILEFVEGGVLFDKIVQLRHYSEAQASVLIKNFLLALEHLDAHGIIHRDLKPENLLLKRATSENGEHLTDVVLADFGLACRSPGQTCCGSPSYIAPEVINVGYLKTSKEPYDGRCDVWSLGTITYILLSGKMPFHGNNFKETFARIIKGHFSFSGKVWSQVSDCAKDFITTILVRDPKARPTASQALKHPWVVNTQPNVHLQVQVENIRLFNAQQKLRASFMVFRATAALLGHLDQKPPFLKYLNHKDKMSTIIEAKSQTDPNKTHYVDFSCALLRSTPGWKLQDCCTCSSLSVCRHIQNVHEYLFVGRVDLDVTAFINELVSLKEDAEGELEIDPNNEAAEERLAEVLNIINAAKIFREEYLKVPQEAMKPNAMLMVPKGNAGRLSRILGNRTKQKEVPKQF